MTNSQHSRHHARVIKRWSIRYPDPIELGAGDQVTLGKQDREYPGWIWATSGKGKSGWVPETYLDIVDDKGVARRSYSAQEIAVEEGEIVRVGQELLGWSWVEAVDGRQGWLPGGNLARSTSPIDLPL